MSKQKTLWELAEEAVKAEQEAQAEWVRARRDDPMWTQAEEGYWIRSDAVYVLDNQKKQMS